MKNEKLSLRNVSIHFLNCVCVSIICVRDTTENLLNSNYVLNFKEPVKVRTVSNSNLNQTSDLRNTT